MWRTRGTLAFIRRRAALSAAALSALLAAGCGGSIDPIAGDDAPAITAPGTTAPYESGGADGSGADGSTRRDQRGGVGGSADASPEPR